MSPRESAFPTLSTQAEKPSVPVNELWNRLVDRGRDTRGFLCPDLNTGTCTRRMEPNRNGASTGI